MPLKTLAVVSVLWLWAAVAAAQDSPRYFAGALVGVSTLSADGHAATTASEAALSLYKPENGGALNVLGGIRLHDYFSVQANWMWNRNDLTLVSALTTSNGGTFYEQQRRSRQHAGVLDGLVYFRRADSIVRPYLGTGLAVLHFSSRSIATAGHGLGAPDGSIASTRIGLRSHVGIDVRLNEGLIFRYSFSETISRNPISPALTPPAPRRLANFQNLFGLITRF